LVPRAEAGSALAYAHVTKNGEVESANGRNVDNVKVETPEPGVYCLSGLTFKPHNAAATIDANELVLPLISTTLEWARARPAARKRPRSRSKRGRRAWRGTAKVKPRWSGDGQQGLLPGDH